ncbi:hypothetical protein [Ensifer sp. MJa1]|uniref:hypothetical protein n=1 Tax=Ensifer sp. MJa1 TaxID=2919888 RepID=UPI003009A500
MKTARLLHRLEGKQSLFAGPTMAALSCYRKREPWNRTIVEGWFTPRHRWFCRFVALGCGPKAAAIFSGLDTANASRMMHHLGFHEHITELRTGKDRWMATARRGILPRLNVRREAAMRSGRYDEAAKATMLMALIAGFLPPSKGERIGRLPACEALSVDAAKALGLHLLSPKYIPKKHRLRRKAKRRVPAGTSESAAAAA